MVKVSLEKAKEQYTGQWLAFLVTEETPTGELLGQVITHNRNGDTSHIYWQRAERIAKNAHGS